ECTLPYGTIAHVAHVDIVDAIIFFRKRDTCAQRNLAAYDTVPAHEFVFFAEKVHGAAFAFGTSRCFAKKFGHDGIGRYTLGEGVSVATVGRNHRVFGAQNRHGACYHGLLADVEVAKSTDFLLSVQLTGFFFKLAHEQHGLIPLQIRFFFYGCRTHFNVCLLIQFLEGKLRQKCCDMQLTTGPFRYFVLVSFFFWRGEGTISGTRSMVTKLESRPNPRSSERLKVFNTL